VVVVESQIEAQNSLALLYVSRPFPERWSDAGEVHDVPTTAANPPEAKPRTRSDGLLSFVVGC